MINVTESSKILGSLPLILRDELLTTVDNIITNYREGKWEPSELNGGKLCEVVYSILDGYVSNSFPTRSSKPSDMVSACRQLENADKNKYPRSVRIHIPRMLMALYEVRNNRGVGHVGGEVNSNLMDATAVLYMSKWVVAEIIRVFHNVDTKKATELVDSIMEREIPLIWLINNKKKVLNKKFTTKEKVLVLLYSETGSVKESDLMLWTEYKNTTDFKRKILIPLHNDLQIDFDQTTKEVRISPIGADNVEKKLLTRTN